MSENFYTPHPLPEFAGNPLVEVLKPLPADVREKAKLLMRKPAYNMEQELSLDSSLRRLCPGRLKSFMFPMEKHVEMFSKIHSLIVGGYKDRNPLTAQGQQSLYQRSTSPSTVTFITGLSGIGKSALVRSIMKAVGNQVIDHAEYNGQRCPYTQILYVMQNVPVNSTPKNMCMTLGSELDNLLQREVVTPIFAKNRTHTDFIQGLKRSVKHLRVGAIVIDELQNVNLRRGANRDEFLAMISNFRDELGVPIILIGTTAAKSILFSNKNISVQRRFCDGGFEELEPPKSAADEDWYTFCKTMWRYQWVTDPMQFTDEVCELLYTLSQGITGILLTLFINCQMTAIGGQERIDTNLVRKVYQDQMKPLHAALDALRSGDPIRMARFDDLYFSAANSVRNFANYRMEEVNNGALSQTAASESAPKPSSQQRQKRTPKQAAELRDEVTTNAEDYQKVEAIFHG
ncbi:ATP-binding protein [Geomonas nitrogeniifigens]|uniref:ATP-binding protein n=1 Tax=Geomonas diazotrophica TaxID=2843197 RepID=A0ABX8JFV8_9BACT|nr:ATP-binding protein [Geomonas nitrogeniifigens]QWV97283.1 ATP-binding protein [Geomonas nitrogeniifigens]